MINLKKNKLRTLRLAARLGATNGLVLGIFSVILLFSGYSIERYLIGGSTSPGLHIQMTPFSGRWFYLPLLSTILFCIAALTVQFFLSAHLKSNLWFWQAVGLIAVLELYLMNLGIDIYLASFTDIGPVHWHDADSLKLNIWFYVLLYVEFFNLLYSGALFYLRSDHPKKVALY